MNMKSALFYAVIVSAGAPLALSTPVLSAGSGGSSLFSTSKPAKTTKKKAAKPAKKQKKQKKVVKKKATRTYTQMELAEADIRRGRFKKADKRLQRMVKKNPKNADAWNLIGFSNRKLERYDVSWEAYQTALKLDPKHRGANEYLGEWYLQKDQPEGAVKQYGVLANICNGCKEQAELEKAIVNFSLRGMDSEKIKSLQAELLEAGFYKGSVDGQFGRGSRSALRAYQNAKGINEIGFLQATLQALSPSS